MFLYKIPLRDFFLILDTKVKFIPDFKDAKPKLNVCVSVNNNTYDFIIPNLYFSQAQLNFLSLCVFLAKALNAEDDSGNSIDCIFVDDPIQSMDSINILSTIDLFRNIVVNEEKQIIFSTHDENVHNLLKKKMPPTLFKSKFMELESFIASAESVIICPFSANCRTPFLSLLNASLSNSAELICRSSSR